MILNSSEIKEKNIIVSSEFTKYNQTGVDLSVRKIYKILGGMKVLKDKTDANALIYKEVIISSNDMYHLTQGAYALEFHEGCNIPADVTGKITTRSSLYRGGSVINSPLWDPGFKTEIMGTTLIVNAPITIEANSRVAQMFFWKGEVPEQLYDGQWQNKTNK